MSRLTRDQVRLLRKCLLQDVVLRAAKPAARVDDVSWLRQHGMIKVTLNWERSSRAAVHRTIELTPAGLDALRAHRDVI